MLPARRVSRAARTAAAIFCASLIGCGQPAPRPLRIGLLVWPGFEPAYLARQRGYLDSAAVQLVDYTSASDMTRAMNNGQIDALALTFVSGIQLASTDSSIRAIMVLDVSNGADAVLGAADVTTIRALKGRPVAISPSGGSAYLVSRALEAAGMTLDDVIKVRMDEANTEEALRSGRVAAVMAYEPQRSRMLQHSAHQLFSSADVKGEIADVLLARASTVVERREALRGFMTAWYRAVDDLHAQREATSALLAAREHVSAADFRAMLDLLEIPGPGEARALLADSTSAFFRSGRRFARMMRDEGVLRRDVDVAHVIDASLLGGAP